MRPAFGNERMQKPPRRSVLDSVRARSRLPCFAPSPLPSFCLTRFESSCSLGSLGLVIVLFGGDAPVLVDSLLFVLRRCFYGTLICCIQLGSPLWLRVLSIRCSSANLASITSEEGNAFIRKWIAEPDTIYWIGLNDQETEAE